MLPSKNPVEVVGRAQEIDQLYKSLARAKQAQGQVVYIIGDAGIGKSRLLASLTDLALANDFAVARGECSEQDQDFPYGPVIDGLRTHFSRASADEVERIIGPFRQELIRLLPEMALRIDAPAPPAVLEPEAEKRRLFEVLIQIYQRLGTTGLLLIFEDIHWSDGNSIEFFQTLTRRVRHLPILVALSSRPTEPNSAAARLQLYVDRADNAVSLPLTPLTEAEVDSFAKSILQTTQPIHPTLLEKLVTLSQGNPLYVEQIVYMLLQNRQINLVNGTWMVTASSASVEIPTSISRTVEQQVERLSDATRRVLQYAAVVGRQFELDVLIELTALDEPQLTQVVKELIQRRFFEEVSRDRFAFRHALLRHAIYENLLIRERQTLHQALLDIFEKLPSNQADLHLAELAYHAYQAQAWEAALRYGLRAGQHAIALHSPQAAIEHITHAVDATQHMGGEASWEMLMQRGRAYDDLGEFRPALDDYQAALDIAERNDDPHAVWEMLIAIALLWAARDYAQTEAYCRRAYAVAKTMDEPRLVGHSLNRLGNWYLNAGQPFDALRYHEQALALFEDLDDLPGKGETLDLLGMTSGHALQLAHQLAYYREAVTIFRSLDDRKALASALSNLSLCSLDPVLSSEAIEISHQIGWYSGEAYACITAGYVSSFFGHFTASFAYYRRGQELAQALDHTQWLAGVHLFSGFLYKDMLDPDQAAAHTEEGIALANAVGSHWFSEMGRGLLAQIRLDQGQLDAAADLLAQREVPDLPAMQYLSAMIAQADLALAHGDAEAALLACERIRRVWPLDVESIPLSAFGTAPYRRARASALALQGHNEEAIEELQQIRHICEQAGLLPTSWQIETTLGRIAMPHDAKLAEQAFQRARATLEQLAANVPPDRRSEFLERATKRMQTSSATESQKVASQKPKGNMNASYFELTRREVDIVREVAAGKSNQQIADSLHITVKTVETHLTRIFSKLDLTSRTQVALWAAANDLTSDTA